MTSPAARAPVPPAASATEGAVPPVDPRRWAALAVAFVGTFMALLDVFIVLVAAPTIQRGLHATTGEIQFVLAGYQLTYAVTLVTGGRLGDLHGRKRLFMWGLAFFTATSALCGLAPTAPALIGARLLQGIGAALLFPQVFSLIQVLLPAQEERRRAFGIMGAVIGLATIVGQLAGGLLIRANLLGLGWRPVFLVNVPIGLIALIAAARLIPESRAPTARRLDLGGVVLLTLALGLLMIPLVEGRAAGWPAWVWGCLALAAAALVSFLAYERRLGRRAGAPLVDLALFAERPFVVGIALVLVYYSALNSFFLVLSLALQDGLGLSALGAGLVYAPQAVSFFLASLLAARLSRRLGRALLVLGAAIAALGFGWTVAVAVAEGGRLTAAAIVPTLIVQGLGEGLFQTPLLNAVLARVRVEHVGTASGVLSTVQQVGGALGVALIGIIFFGTLGAGGGAPADRYAHALAAAVVYNLAVMIAACALLCVLPRRATDTA